MSLVYKHTRFKKLLSQLNIIAISFVSLFAVFLGIYQAWGIQTSDVIRGQWIATLMATMIFIAITILSSVKKAKDAYFYFLITAQIICYMLFISYIIYSQRGMASSAAILYTVPILISATTRASWAVFTTASLAAISYLFATTKYFMNFPSEGYKAELYGQVIFYFLLFILMARLIHVVLTDKNNNR